MADGQFIAHVTAELDTSKAQQQLDNLTKERKVKLTTDTGNSKQSVDGVNNSMKNAQKTANNLGNTMKKSFQIGTAAAVTHKSIQLINTAARNATEAIKQFDDAIMDLRMATGQSYQETYDLVQGYNALGKALGATTQEVSNGADAWLRQGHSIQDTNTLIKDSMMLAKIGQIDSADATKYLTSAMKGYGVEVQNVQEIVDKLCAVDLVSATNSAGLAEAMSRTAVTANMAGVSMDRLLGYLAVVGETTQKSMSSIGESFKTIFTRMSDIKSEKLELVDEDGTVETLSDVEMTLKNVGIDLRDTIDEYNNYGDVLDNLAEKWDGLSEVQQNAISKAFAGTRQQENFRVLMENYDTARQYMETAANSAGTAETKFGAYLDSIEAKTKTLQASFESLAVNTVSTEMFGGIIEATNDLVQFLDTTNLVKGSLAGLAAVGAIKTFTTMASGIKSAAIQMNNFNIAMKMAKAGNLATDDFAKLTTLTQNLSKSQLKAVVSCKALSAEQRTAILMSTGLSEAEAKASLSAMGLASAEGTATAATFSLSGAFKGLWATLMANPLILVVAGVTAAVSAYSSYQQKVEEARQAQLEAGNAARENADNIRDLYNAYNEASSAYANNTGLKENLTSATDALLSALGVEQSQIEALKEEYGGLDEAINQVTRDALKSDLAEMTAGYSAAVETLLDTTKDGWFSSFALLDFTHGDNGKIFADTLKNAGLIDSGSYGSAGGSIYLGDNETIEGVIESYKYLQQLSDALNQGVTDGKYTREELSNSNLYKSINDKINSFSEEYGVVEDYIKEINETAAQLQFMDEIKETGIPKTAKEFEALKQSMSEAAAESGNFVGTQEDIDSAITNALADVPELSQFYNNTAEAAVEGSEIVAEANANITESVTNAGDTVTKLIDGIKSVQDVIGSRQAGKSISITDFNSDELRDYQGALEYVNGTMQLNAEKVREITEAKAEEQIAINNTNKALEQVKYLENAKKIEEYRQKIRDKNFAEGESQDSIQSNIDALLQENSAIAETCKQYDLLSSSIQEAIGAYSNWLNSQSASDYGDMANDAVSAIERIRDTYDEESDIFGDFGSKKFDAAVEFIVPDSVDQDDLSAIESYMADFKQYLSFDKDGNMEGLDVDTFLSNAVKAGLMTYSDDDGFQIAGQKSMEDFADGLNMSSGMVQAFFDELQLKGAEFDWSDEAVKSIGDLAVEANEAAESLRKIEGNENLKIKMDVSDLATTEEQVSALDATIKEIEGVRDVSVDASSIDNANAVIQYCLTQKQLLTQPDVMRVDTSQVSEDLASAISLLQQFQTAQNDLEIKAKVGADTTEAQSTVDSLTSEIQSMSATYIDLGLNIDTTSVESIKTSINGLTAQMMVDVGVNDAAITGYNPDSKNCDVIYKPDTDALPTSFDDINRTVNYVPVTDSLPSNFRTITRYVNYVKTGDVSVNGTAHAQGTAKVGGDWGATGGRTLVGELGREIVVVGSKWYTVGDSGAEFVNIPPGAIVFNHLQTEDLLAHGFVSGRASAMMNGSAMVTGGYKPYKPSGSTTTSNKTTASKNSSYKTPSTSSSTSTKSYDKDSKDFEKSINFVEIALQRITEAFDRLKVKAESVYKTLTKRNSAAADMIQILTEEIDLQGAAYNKYMQQANAVGLSDTWKQKVKDGAIDISTITDENLAEKIEDFKEYYEKAIECKDAVADLKEEIAGLYSDRFNNISDDFDNQLSLLEHLSTTYNTGMDELTAKGLLGSQKYYEALQNVEKQNQAILQQELVDLVEAYNQAMDSGMIEKYSQEWYNMQNSINEVKEELQDSTLAVEEFEKAMREIDWEYFDFLQERISAITSESDFLIDLMSNDKMFDDKGNMTDSGMVTMGLHGQNYNVYMNQADQYKKEADEISEQLANDPTNTDLLLRREELLELQRESILAAEDEKQAIVDLIEEGIQVQIDSMNELINSYVESLDSAKDLYDFQKKVKEQTAEIASLQKQLSAYKNDTSEETRAIKQRLEVDLSKAMEALEETQYDQYITDQKKLMDQLSLDYETFLNQRLDNVDSLISDTIDAINTNSSSIATTLQTESANVGYAMSDALTTIWGNEGGANSIITKYGENFSQQLTTVNTALKICSDYVTSLVNKANEEAQKKIEETEKETPAQEPNNPVVTPTQNPTPTPKPTGTQGDGKIQVGDKVTFASGKYYYSSDGKSPTGSKNRGKQVYVTKINTASWATKPYHISTGSKLGSGDLGWLTKGQLSGYASGLKKANKSEDAWVNELGTESIISPTNRAIITHVNKGDTVLDHGATENIWDMANDPSGFISSHLIDVFPAAANWGNSNINQTFNMPIEIDHVQDYNDFIRQLQHDPKAERMIQAMTIGRISGRSKLNKYKYKF